MRRRPWASRAEGTDGRGDIAHGDGLVDSRRRTQAGELARQRIIGRQVAEQHGRLACVGFRLPLGFGFVCDLNFGILDARFILGALDIAFTLIDFNRAFDFLARRMVLCVVELLLKRDVSYRDSVKALQGLGTRLCILGRILAAACLVTHTSPKFDIGSTMYPKTGPYRAAMRWEIRIFRYVIF